MTVIWRVRRLVPKEYAAEFEALGWWITDGPKNADWAVIATWQSGSEEPPPEPPMDHWTRMWRREFHKPEYIEGNGE